MNELNRLKAECVELRKEVERLKLLFSLESNVSFTPSVILDIVAQSCEFESYNNVNVNSRRHVYRPVKILATYCLQLYFPHLSLSAIGELVYKKVVDHSSVKHNIKLVDNFCDIKDQLILQKLSLIRSKIKQHGNIN